MSALPYDYTRCLNDQCELRKNCLRWLDRPLVVLSYAKFQVIDGRCDFQITPDKGLTINNDLHKNVFPEINKSQNP